MIGRLRRLLLLPGEAIIRGRSRVFPLQITTLIEFEILSSNSKSYAV